MPAKHATTVHGKERNTQSEGQDRSLNLVAVASQAFDEATEGPPFPMSIRVRGLVNDSRRVTYTRVPAHIVGRSAAWMAKRSHRSDLASGAAWPLGSPPADLSDLPWDLDAVEKLLAREEGPEPGHDAVAMAIHSLRTADAVIAGRLAPEDANLPGLVPHMADLACWAYRALRPPRELIVHPGFAKIARRYHFIQMSYRDARSLGSGAIDLGILSRRLQQIMGDGGEFAITACDRQGVLWADRRDWEIDPIGSEGADEEHAGATFCAAWVVARRILNASPPRSLDYARAAAAAAANPRH